MGGIVLELTENVFGRVLRGLLPRPRLGESKLNPVRTAEPWTRRRSPDIDSTNPDPQTAQAPVGPCHGKVAEQRLGAGVERRIAIRFLAVLLPLLYLREKSHPAWLRMLPIFFLITPQFPKRDFRVTHDPLQHPQIRVGRTAVGGGKTRNASAGKQLLWPGCS